MPRKLLMGGALGALIVASAPASAALFTIDYYSSYVENVGVGVAVSGSPFFTEFTDSVSFIDFNTPGPPGRPNAGGPFAAIITGTFNVTGAAQKFTIGSDDGAYLFLNGALVGSNPGLHGYSNLVYDAALAPGDYAFRVEYFNGPCCGAAVGITAEGVTFVPPPGIPEPASWAMMIGGFGVAGGALRRHRSVKANVKLA